MQAVLGNATTKKWTLEEYDRLTEMGFFDGQNIELLWGELIEKMPQDESHSRAIMLVQKQLIRIFDSPLEVRIQLPIRIGDAKPEPDFAVVEMDLRSPLVVPDRAELVVEVANSTLETDRTSKAPLYALGGFPEYWIVNIRDRSLEVRRAPIEAPSALGGWEYSSVQILRAGQTVSPLAAPNAQINVADLLP